MKRAAEKALRELNEELEQRVAARTRELETANAGLQQLAGQLATGVAHEIIIPSALS